MILSAQLGCQQLSKRESSVQKNGLHYWSAKIEFINKLKNNRQSGLAKIYIQGEDHLRMDIMDPFGFVKIGSVVVNKNQAKVNFLKQTPYEGPVYDEMLSDMLKVNITVKDFFSLFTQNDFSKKNWKCDKSSSEAPHSCTHLDQEITISWSGSMKNVGALCTVNHSRADISLKVKDYRLIEEKRDSLFSL